MCHFLIVFRQLLGASPIDPLVAPLQKLLRVPMGAPTFFSEQGPVLSKSGPGYMYILVTYITVQLFWTAPVNFMRPKAYHIF